MPSCLPRCSTENASSFATPSSNFCLQRLRSNSRGGGSQTCASEGCEGVASCAPHCALGWRTATELSLALRRRAHKHAPPQWLLFVGDSDTRGLVLSLLQVLAEAGYSPGVAQNSTELWLGRQEGANNTEPSLLVSRICHLDALYDESGRVVGDVRSIPCKNVGAAEAHAANLSYSMFGADYELRRSEMEWRVRVTFVTTLDGPNLIRGLGELGSSLDGLRRRHGLQPTLLYVNAGAWITKESGRLGAESFVRKLCEFAAQYVRSPLHGGTLVWGGVAAHRASFASHMDEGVLPLLPSEWRVLSRNHSGFRATNGGSSGLRLVSKHAPHLTNLVDIQLLLGGHLAGSPREDDGSCVRRSVLAFAPECAGFGRAMPRKPRFIEGWMHFCRWEVQDVGGWSAAKGVDLSTTGNFTGARAGDGAGAGW